MKDLLILAGAGFLVYHYMSSKTTMQTNPSVDGTGTPVMSSIAASVPMPGTATVGQTGASGVPVASSAGRNTSMRTVNMGLPASLGSDLSTKSGTPNADTSPTALGGAFERMDYTNPFQQRFNMLER